MTEKRKRIKVNSLEEVKEALVIQEEEQPKTEPIKRVENQPRRSRKRWIEGGLKCFRK